MTVEPYYVTWEKRILRSLSSRGWGPTVVDVILVILVLVLVFLYAKPI